MATGPSRRVRRYSVVMALGLMTAFTFLARRCDRSVPGRAPLADPPPPDHSSSPAAWPSGYSRVPPQQEFQSMTPIMRSLLAAMIAPSGFVLAACEPIETSALRDIEAAAEGLREGAAFGGDGDPGMDVVAIEPTFVHFQDILNLSGF